MILRTVAGEPCFNVDSSHSFSGEIPFSKMSAILVGEIYEEPLSAAFSVSLWSVVLDLLGDTRRRLDLCRRLDLDALVCRSFMFSSFFSCCSVPFFGLGFISSLFYLYLPAVGHPLMVDYPLCLRSLTATHLGCWRLR